MELTAESLVLKEKNELLMRADMPKKVHLHHDKLRWIVLLAQQTSS